MAVRHENVTELSEFALAAVNSLKEAGHVLPQCLNQFLIEVNGYGWGLSNMSADEWFNLDDFGDRIRWGNEIQAMHEAYQKKEIEEAAAVTEAVNPILAELNNLKAQVEALTEAKTKAEKGQDIADMHTHEEMDKMIADKQGEEGSDEEEASESDEEAAAEGDKPKKG